MDMLFKALLLLSTCGSLFAKEFRIIDMASTANIGLFATANQVLGNLYLYETGRLPNLSGITVNLGVNGLYYDPGRGNNWWSYYFEPVLVGERGDSTISHPTRADAIAASSTRLRMKRTEAVALVNKYIRVKQPILDKVKQFQDAYFQDAYVIGVHYRGTDKKKEAMRLPYETVLEKIGEQIPTDRPCRIFIATDEASFLTAALAAFPNRVIATEARRVDGTTGVHFTYRNQYAMGEEALIDALLLSKCNCLIRTSSNLSLWSTYFNPDLPVILLSRIRAATTEPE